MTHQVLARKCRPRSFQDVVGQEHTLRVLKNALMQNRIHHAYLFSGTKGVGKTTITRILAKCLSCESALSPTPCGHCATCISIDQGNNSEVIKKLLNHPKINQNFSVSKSVCTDHLLFCEGDTLLHIASRLGDKKILRDLVKKDVSFKKNKHGDLPRDVANNEKIKLIIDLLSYKKTNLFLKFPWNSETMQAINTLEKVMIDDVEIDALSSYRDVITKNVILNKIFENYGLKIELEQKELETKLNALPSSNINQPQVDTSVPSLSNEKEEIVDEESKQQPPVLSVSLTVTEADLKNPNLKDASSNLNSNQDIIYLENHSEENISPSDTLIKDLSNIGNQENLKILTLDKAKESALDKVKKSLNDTDWTLEELLKIGELLLDEKNTSLLYLRKERRSFLKLFQAYGNTDTWRDIFAILQKKIEEKLESGVYFVSDIGVEKKNNLQEEEKYIKEKINIQEKSYGKIVLDEIKKAKNPNKGNIEINGQSVYTQTTFFALKHIQNYNAGWRNYDPSTWRWFEPEHFSTEKMQFSEAEEIPDRKYVIKIMKNKN